jgi:AcrR family transcriptional regulator
MGRKPSIDRDQVLSAAEAIVASKGAAALTVDAVAKAAGISKGGVQSCFGTKEAMISAMLDRWLRGYEEQARSLVGDTQTPEKRIQAHAVITFAEDQESQERSASLLAALLHSPEHLQTTRAWYEQLMAGLNETSPEASRLRLALLATEGAIYLRYLGLMPMDDARWMLFRDDINTLLQG